MSAARSDPPGHVSIPERATTAYRDDFSAAVLRREELLRLHREDIERAPAICALLARRKARTAAGLVGVASFLAVAIGALNAIADGVEHRGGLLTRVLLGSWVVALAVWIAVRVLAGRAARSRLGAWGAKTDQPAADVARLEAPAPLMESKREAAALEVRSIAAPMMGAAMLLPLTLHLVFTLESPDRFDRWIVASVAFVGHAHLLFAALCWRYARRLCKDGPAVGATLEGYKALIVTAAACVFPTVVFAPILVLVTGAIPAPVIFLVARRVLARERAVLDPSELEWGELRLGRAREVPRPGFPLPASALNSVRTRL